MTPRTRSRAGVAAFTLAALAITGLVAMTTGIQQLLRRSADRVIAHRQAVSEAVALAESAAEESLFIIGQPGSFDPKPSAVLRVEAAATARLARECSESRIQLSPVEVRWIGPVIRDSAGIEGAIEITAAACVRLAVFPGGEVSRRVVRRYRWSQVDAGTGPGAPCLELLVQWVAP